jgi:hypothetical protein
MTHYDTVIIAYNSVIIVTGFADVRHIPGLEYSIYLTTRSICLEYSDILVYLEYVNPVPIPGMCLEYA